MMLRTFSRLRHVIRAARLKGEAESFRRALEFNMEATFTDARRGQWMCPTCNSIHVKVCFTPRVGDIFPACCDFSRGPRLDRRYATGRE